MKKRKSLRLAISGVLTVPAVAGGALAADNVVPAEAAVCGAAPDCTNPDADYGSVCYDRKDIWQSVYTGTNGYVYAYYCHEYRTLFGTTVWDPPWDFDGTTMVTRTFKDPNVSLMVSDTHGLGLGILNGTKYTMMLNDADLWGYVMGWTGSEWLHTDPY